MPMIVSESAIGKYVKVPSCSPHKHSSAFVLKGFYIKVTARMKYERLVEEKCKEKIQRLEAITMHKGSISNGEVKVGRYTKH